MGFKRLRKVKIFTVFFLLVFGFTNFLIADDLFKITVQTPPFVSPGDKNVTIQATIKLEKGDYEDVEAKLVLPQVFKPSKTGSDTYKLGDMSTEKKLTPSMGVALFQIDVEEGTLYGNYDILMIITSRKLEIYRYTFSLKVVGKTLVDITTVILDKEISPGDEFKITIGLKNIGENKLNYLKVILTPNPQQIPIFVPISSDLQWTFKDVRGGSEVTASFKLAAQSDIESKNYSMIVSLVYQDETGMVFNETHEIGVRVKGSPKVVLQGIEADPVVPTEGEEVTISITVENTGNADAKSVKIELNSEVGNFTSFIGTVKREDSDAAVFKVLIPVTQRSIPFIREVSPRELPMTITVSYEDLDGNTFKLREEWRITARPKRDTTIFYATGGVILLIGFLVWRWNRKRQLKALE